MSRKERNLPKRILTRLLLLQACLILAALVGASLVARHFFKLSFIEQVEHQLSDTLIMLSREKTELLRAPSQCNELAAGTNLRFTFISADGTVQCDSHRDSEEMDNHLTRAEVQTAVKAGIGYSIRYSDTIGQDMMYGALKVGEVGFLRAAMPLSILSQALHAFDYSLGAILLFIALCLLIFAISSGRAIINPAIGEWTELESSMDRIGKDLEKMSESTLR